MLLLLLFGMALAWFLQKKLYQKNWQKNLKIQVIFQDSAIYEGEESTLKEVIVNDKLVRVAIQNFLKNPVISMVFGHPNRKISCISPHIRATVLRQPPFFTPKI